MKYVNGLAILRRISPPQQLEDLLDKEGWLIAIETGTGRDRRTVYHIDDDIPRDKHYTEAIMGRPNRDGDLVGGCSDGYSIVDENNNIHGFVGSLIRAQEIVARAKRTIITEYDLEAEEEQRKGRSKKTETEAPPAGEPAQVSA